MNIQPVGLTRNFFAWCANLFREYLPAIVPALKVDKDLIVLAQLELHGQEVGSVVCWAYFCEELGFFYSVEIEADKFNIEIEVATGHLEYQAIHTDEPMCSVEKALEHLRSTKPLPMGDFCYMQLGVPQAIIRFDGEWEHLTIFGRPGSTIPLDIIHLNVEDFWRMYSESISDALNVIVPLHVVSQTKFVYGVDIPCHLVADAPHIPAYEEEEVEGVALQSTEKYRGVPQTQLFLPVDGWTHRVPQVLLREDDDLSGYTQPYDAAYVTNVEEQLVLRGLL